MPDMAEQTVKLHTFLAHAGIASRRAAESLIEAGFVRVNGDIIKNVATRINPRKDAVMYKDVRIVPANKVYVVAWKTKGMVCTTKDPENRPTIMKFAPKNSRAYPVDRIDASFSGLVLLTNDGDFAFMMSNPASNILHTYNVLINGSPSNSSLTALHARAGQGGNVSVSGHEHSNTWLKITLHETPRMSVQRLVSLARLQPIEVVRLEMGPFTLQGLSENRSRMAYTTELNAVGVRQ